MACQNCIQRGPVPQSSGLPGLAPVAVFPGPLPACHPAGRLGRPPWALASPSPGLSVAGAPAGPLPIARAPAPARPAAASRSLNPPEEALLTRTMGLTCAGNRGRPRRVRPRARCGVGPGPVSRRVRGRGHAAPSPPPAPAAWLVKTPAGEGFPSGRASRNPRDAGRLPERRLGRHWREGPGEEAVPCRAGPGRKSDCPQLRRLPQRWSYPGSNRDQRMSEGRGLTQEQEQLRLQGLRILARIIARRRLACPGVTRRPPSLRVKLNRPHVTRNEPAGWANVAPVRPPGRWPGLPAPGGPTPRGRPCTALSLLTLFPGSRDPANSQQVEPNPGPRRRKRGRSGN